MWDLLSRLRELIVPDMSGKATFGLARAQYMAATSRVSGSTDRVAIRSADMSGGSAAPFGIAFSVPELLILRGWAEYHAIRVVVELDHCVDGAEYEEVIALYPAGSSLRQWTLWRSREAVVVEPRHGRAFKATCISELVQVLMPAAL
ncbi:MAG TPA: hypothetical protein VJ779_06980 [Acetobacteraceae bacterium]|nr:hypothetical protein [Acetobacteraceae bacterium]